MTDELSNIAIPNIDVSLSSPVDIVTTLITSAASIHNVNNITRAKYVEIYSALKAYDETLGTYEKAFAEKMLRQKENLDQIYRLLDVAFEGVKDSSVEKAAIWHDMATHLMRLIEQLNKDGPQIPNISWNL